MFGLSPRTALVAPLALAAAVACLPAHADVLLHTDASWQVTAVAPSGAWNSSATFDASSWQAATVLYNVSAYLGPAYLAQGLWTSGGQFSQTETSMWARKVFDLAALPVNASMLVGMDDDGDVWINGQWVAGNHDGVAGNFGVANLLPYLQLGSNVIAYTVTDNFPVYGYNHSAWLQIDGQPGAPSAVPEPGTVVLLLCGLAGLAFTRRHEPAA